MGERVTVEGTVENVIFHNEENGYTVLLLTVEGEEEPVTVVGCIPCAAAGEGMTVTGVWSVHPVHGSQLTAESVERRMPEREEDMIAYLSSGILKGVGPATAQRLVERFGTDTMLVIEQEPERLRCIKGITAQRAKELSDAFRALTGLRQLMEFLARYDLPVYLAMPLQRTYGDGAIQALRDDPYILSRAQYGVDFSTVDEIAISLGFDGDDPCRLRAALTYELEHNAANGHVFLPREKLLFATSQLLAVTPDELELALDKLIEGFGVVEKTIAGVQGCYLPRLYQAETFVAERLLSLVRTPVEVLPRAEKVIDDIEKEQGVAYAPLQRQAVCLAAQGGILLLTGGPGTGKTTSLRGIVSLYERMGLDVALLAPTGRAAKRLGEVTGREAQTIHRALGMSYNELTGQTAFKKNAQDPLEVHAVIVDEMSMVDIELMRSLLEAMRPGSRLVLVGDPDQLPSVGPGSVLGDMLRSGVVPAVSLTQVFRQAEQSAIIRNAHAVNLGQPPQLANNQGDFFFLCRRDGERTLSTVVELCKTRLPDHMGIPADQIQVLTPTRKGPSGTENLNRCLQAALNPPAADKREIQWGERLFRTGDRIMQTKNNYNVVWEKADGTVGTGMFNGDVGRIVEIDPSGELLVVNFDDRIATYTLDMLNEIDLAYAMTVHKAQGSEYQCVVLAAMPAAPSLMVRGVLYTALTRARELLIVVGDDAAIRAMAAQGPCVIVGFCADHVLSGTEGLIRVFLHSDIDHRVERIIRQYGLPEGEARRVALRQDRERSRRYGVCTGGKWADLAHYDLTVDCGPLGVEGTVELLSQFVALKVMRGRRNAPTLSQEVSHAGERD